MFALQGIREIVPKSSILSPSPPGLLSFPPTYGGQGTSQNPDRHLEKITAFGEKDPRRQSHQQNTNHKNHPPLPAARNPPSPTVTLGRKPDFLFGVSHSSPVMVTGFWMKSRADITAGFFEQLGALHFGCRLVVAREGVVNLRRPSSNNALRQRFIFRNGDEDLDEELGMRAPRYL